MNTVKNYGLPAAPSFMKSSAPAADYSTETSFLGPVARWYGEASSLRGDGLAVGLLLIFLFAAALLIPFERWTLPEQDGSKSSPSISTGSPQKKKSGGTAREQYEEK